MLNTLNINLKTDIKTDRPTTLPITLMSQDKNNNQFILRFTNGGEPVNLDDTYTVEILTKFKNSGTSRLTSATVRQDYATWEFDTAYITQDETVYNYVYVRKSGGLVVSADANCFVFSVDLSEIDKGAGKVAETYDENYEKYLDEFKDNVDFEEIAQAEQARREAELLREESYEQKVDTAIVEADVVEKVDNKVTELTPKITELTAQLAQTTSYTDRDKNSDYVLQIFNPYKNIENIHPKVLYFATPWNGYNYWMAYTPYPRGNVSFENPCLAVSNDGLNWETPPGVTNPLEPFSGNLNIYNNDTHLVYRADTNTLEIWWRLANTTDKVSTIKRRTSTNGFTWTPTENMLIGQTDGNDYLSPAIIFEDNKYKMWSVSATNGSLRYCESNDGLTWSTPTVVNVNWGMLTPWHIDVIKTDLGYEFVVQCWEPGKTNNTSSLYYVQSTDLINFTDPLLILKPSKELGKFDNQGIYRASLLKKNGIYYLYYSAVATDGTRGIALSYGEDISLLKGVSSKSTPSQKIYGLEKTYTKEQIAQDLYVENFITVQRQTSNPARPGAFCYEDNLVGGAAAGTLKVHDGTKYNILQHGFLRDFVMADNGTIQTLSTGVETVVNFTSRKRDLGARWSTTTMKYTVSEKGIFTVHAHLDVSSLGGGSFELAAMVNGTTKHILTFEENLTGRKIIQGSRTIQLETADTVEIVVTYVGTGSPQIGVNRFLTIEKLNHNW